MTIECTASKKQKCVFLSVRKRDFISVLVFSANSPSGRNHITFIFIDLRNISLLMGLPGEQNQTLCGGSARVEKNFPSQNARLWCFLWPCHERMLQIHFCYPRRRCIEFLFIEARFTTV